MAARVTRIAPAAAQETPDQEVREQSLRALRLELEAQSEAGLAALLQHEVARLHERREDLASAARDELATTKRAAGFVEPVESLIDIATRSRSKANLAKLLERLIKLSRTPGEKLRASLGLALTHLSNDNIQAARETLDLALEDSPSESALWLALEMVAAATGDTALLLRAATGRAAHAESLEMRCLLLERVARLEVEGGTSEAAFAALRQSVDELPTWRALRAWEELGLRSRSYEEAQTAALQTATILRAGLEEPEEASLYQIPSEELSEDRAVAAHVRAIIYAIRSGDDEVARGLCVQLSDASPNSALAVSLLTELCRKQRDADGLYDGISQLIEARKWSANESAFLEALRALAARDAGKDDEVQQSLARLREVAPGSMLSRIEDWQRAQANESPDHLIELLRNWAQEATTGESTLHLDADGLFLSVALFEIISGRGEAAQAALKARKSRGDALGQLFAYVARSLEGRGRRLTLPPGVGSGDDRIAANWDRLRIDLAEGRPPADGNIDEDASGGARDPWAAFALSLLLDGPTPPPTAQAPVLVSESKGSAPPAMPRESEPPEQAGPGDTDPADEIAAFASQEATAPSPYDTEDGVVAVLTQSSIPPGDVETADAPPEYAEIAANLGRDDSGEEQPDLSAGAETDDTLETGTRGKLAAYFQTGEGSSPFRRALRVFELAGWGDVAQLRSQWEATPSDPLLAGAYLNTLESSSDPALPRARRKAADRQEDGLLRAAWLLKSTADELSCGEGRRAKEAFDSSEVFPDDELLDSWFAASVGPRDPQSLTQAMESGTNFSPLEAAALIRRWAPDRWANLDLSSPPPALQLLQILQTAPESLEALEYALDDSELLTESERAALALARVGGPDESEELLTATERWVRISPSPSSKLTHWVAATRSRKAEAQATMIEALATDLQAPSLLAAIPGAHLNKEGRQRYRALLLAHRDAAEGTAAQSLSWTIFDQTEDAISESHAAELSRLSLLLDSGLVDADAQAALLLAGYEYLALGNFDEAIRVFESLLEVLPGDLTLCHGARIAAARVNRPDLEAITSCELARATEDNLKSAALWERAGVLFQDELDDREEAEKCFSAALARSPGSRVSFERIYRLARDRNDRQRQVELIDARLDTADSESLLIELYWEKARFCRMLGRRTIALRSLEELLKLAPDHLPALALAAELHLVDGRIDAAAEALRTVARHPDTPAAERNAAGLHACDLFEQLKRHREAVELLQVLDEYGVSGSPGLERRARSLARSEDWGEAYLAFAALNAEQDQIEARLESAQMMLAIQRDHLKDPEELRRAARCVLRDAPLDPDAIQVVLDQEFALDERRRLLTPVRGQSRDLLRRNPLNPPEIRRFAELCLDCGEDYMERIALGILGLTGKLSEDYRARLNKLMTSCLALPSQPLSKADLESISEPLQLGATGRYLSLLAPYLSAELDPSLEAQGFSSLMRTDEFSGSSHRAEIGTWMGCFGHNDFELYVGGTDPLLIRGVMGALPTMLIGRDVPVPLTPVDRARVVVQLAALHHGSVVYLNHDPDELKKWIRASEVLAGGTPTGERAEEEDELVRLLSKAVPADIREELVGLYATLGRTGIDLTLAPHVAMRGAARAACVAQGESRILRELPALIPADQDLLNAMMSDIIRFVLSSEFINIRRRIGLEGA